MCMFRLYKKEREGFVKLERLNPMMLEAWLGDGQLACCDMLPCISKFTITCSQQLQSSSPARVGLWRHKLCCRPAQSDRLALMVSAPDDLNIIPCINTACLHCRPNGQAAPESRPNSGQQGSRQASLRRNGSGNARQGQLAGFVGLAPVSYHASELVWLSVVWHA
jgi:hypothetical protein